MCFKSKVPKAPPPPPPPPPPEPPKPFIAGGEEAKRKKAEAGGKVPKKQSLKIGLSTGVKENGLGIGGI